jgi:dipeptidyl aminopeptidase/acylaminoacyl peptidase
MSHPVVRRALLALAVLVLPLLPLFTAARPLQAADDTAATVTIPENMRVRHVPPIPTEATEDLLPYENLRFANFQGWHPEERRILITTRFGETYQLHEVAFPLGARKQLTFYGERVFGGSYRPSDPSQIVFSFDQGGAENYQLYLLDRDTGDITRFSDGVHRYQGTLWSDDGKWLAYASNARNGRDFDIYVTDPAKPGSERLVTEVSGLWIPTEFHPDGGKLLALEYISANETHLHVVDLEDGSTREISPSKRGEKVYWGGALWAEDGRHVYTTTDAGSEFRRLVKLDPDTGEWTVLTEDIPWNVGGFDVSDDGELLGFLVNEDGFSRLHLMETATGKRLPTPEVPPGIIGGGGFRPDHHEFALVVNWARSPSDVYTWDPATRKLERWTESEVGGLLPEDFAVPELIRYPTFDTLEDGTRRTIPAFVYRPDPKKFPGPRPVYINIHGGPEGQSQPSFKGTNNYLVDDLGVVLIYPNVRGSSGYGKSYLKLDNAELREDSVKDIGALLDWIATRPELDADRVMVGGGSYGGYMVLASMVHYSDRLRAGFDYVGVSNFVTFLENTQEYRRDLRRAEYGDERDPEMRAHLEAIAPANHADEITKPMLVAQGANDPRVPLSESDQMVKELEENGVPVWYMVAGDEGHGFAKKSNADYLRAVWIEFVRRNLVEPPEVAAPAKAETGQ